MKKHPVLFIFALFLLASCQSQSANAPYSVETSTPTAKLHNTATPTWPPPFPTPTSFWVASPTPAPSELSGYIIFDDLVYPYWDYQIFIEDLATREIKQLTEIGSSGLPEWSPDGQKIAFLSRREGFGNIYLMDRDGNNEEQLTQCVGTNTGGPVWSPDGTKIAFSGDCEKEGSEAIYIVDITTRQLTRLTDYGSYLDVSWSSNGDRIAYVVEKQSNGYIHMMNSDGSEDQEIVSNARQPIWCPDDSCIIYQAGYGKGYIGKLRILDLETEETKVLLSPPYAAPESVDEFLSSRSPVRGYITYSVGGNLYALDLKIDQVYFLGLQSYSGALYP